MCEPAASLIARFGTGRLFLFLKAKLALKGEQFSEISDIKCDVTELLKGVPVQGFQRAFEDLH
jgi:hypothetical protein